MKKVNWKQRFDDVFFVLERAKIPITTKQVQKELWKWSVVLTYAQVHSTLVTMCKTARILRISYQGRDYWAYPSPINKGVASAYQEARQNS